MKESGSAAATSSTFQRTPDFPSSPSFYPHFGAILDLRSTLAIGVITAFRSKVPTTPVMATTSKAAVASGADVGEALRRRNVAATQPAAQQVVQVEDKKKLQKKVSPRHWFTFSPRSRLASPLSDIQLTTLPYCRRLPYFRPSMIGNGSLPPSSSPSSPSSPGSTRLGSPPSSHGTRHS